MKDVILNVTNFNFDVSVARVIFVLDHSLVSLFVEERLNTSNNLFKLCMPFVWLVPVGLLLSSLAVLYHVNGEQQRSYWALR